MESTCYFSHILKKVELSRHLFGTYPNTNSKRTQTQNFNKPLPVGAKLFHVDRQTDMKKLIVVFLNFAHAPKHKGINNI
jgi:hypothetical protein